MIGPSRLARAALVAALLAALPAAVLAQAKPRTAAPSPKPAAAQAAPAVAAEPEPSPGAFAAPIEERGPWRGGALLGYEKDQHSDLGGVRIQLETERDLVPLGARGRLSFVAAAAWFHGTLSTTVGIPLTTITLTTDVATDVFEVIPAFRAAFAPVPRLRLFAEIGVGAGWTQGSVKASSSVAPGVSNTARSDSFVGVFRLATGATFAVNERLRVGVELPAFQRRYGETNTRTLSYSASAAYAF